MYLIYLRGIEEMDNGFFELALNMFTNVLSSLLSGSFERQSSELKNKN